MVFDYQMRYNLLMETPQKPLTKDQSDVLSSIYALLVKIAEENPS